MLLLGVALIIVVFRLPTGDLSTIGKECIEGLANGHLGGYPLAGAAIVAWFLHSRSARKTYMGEIRRLAEERNEWQIKQLGRSKVQSSDSEED